MAVAARLQKSLDPTTGASEGDSTFTDSERGKKRGAIADKKICGKGFTERSGTGHARLVFNWVAASCLRNDNAVQIS